MRESPSLCWTPRLPTSCARASYSAAALRRVPVMKPSSPAIWQPSAAGPAWSGARHVFGRRAYSWVISQRTSPRSASRRNPGPGRRPPLHRPGSPAPRCRRRAQAAAPSGRSGTDSRPAARSRGLERPRPGNRRRAMRTPAVQGPSPWERTAPASPARFGQAPVGGDLAAEHVQQRRARIVQRQHVVPRGRRGRACAVIVERTDAGIGPDDVVLGQRA
jgi:hypothetical protein